jgi:hypothetical protein
MKAYADSALNTKGPLQMVHIYLDNDALFWKERISKVSNSGVHLFCKGNWSEILVNNYGLDTFPFFVLVDPKGIIQYSGNGDYKNALSVFSIQYSKYGQ